MHADAGEACFAPFLRKDRRLVAIAEQGPQHVDIPALHGVAFAHGTEDGRQHVAGFHRGQLVGVAEQHQPRAAGDRIDQFGHQRQVDHRRLVDHHDIER